MGFPLACAHESLCTCCFCASARRLLPACCVACVGDITCAGRFAVQGALWLEMHPAFRQLHVLHGCVNACTDGLLTC